MPTSKPTPVLPEGYSFLPLGEFNPKDHPRLQVYDDEFFGGWRNSQFSGIDCKVSCSPDCYFAIPTPPAPVPSEVAQSTPGHSKLPWKVDAKFTDYIFCAPPDKMSILCFGNKKEADAAHIVRCVNSHAAQSAEIKRLREAVEEENRRLRQDTAELLEAVKESVQTANWPRYCDMARSVLAAVAARAALAQKAVQ